MNDDPTSLDRLHDIVQPSAVSWWPPAPGWYFVLAAALILAGLTGYRLWRTWQAGAYRRAALLELATINSVAAISEVLRRVALVNEPRSKLSALSGNNWTRWLEKHASVPMSDQVRHQLSHDVYASAAIRELAEETTEEAQADQALDKQTDLAALKEYAAQWIEQQGDARADSSEKIDLSHGPNAA